MKFVHFILVLWAFNLARADLVIVQKVERGGQAREMTIKLQGDMLRLDVAPQISVIRNAKTGDTITLLHALKTYSRMSGTAVAALRRQLARQVLDGGAEIPTGSAPKLQPTGNKEKISGFDTEEYTSQAGSMRMRYWIGKDFPNWKMILREMLSMQESGLEQVMKERAPGAADFPGLPIRTEAELGGQKVTTTLVSAKEQPVNETEFTVPAEYTETASPTFDSPPPSPEK